MASRYATPATDMYPLRLRPMPPRLRHRPTLLLSTLSSDCRKPTSVPEAAKSAMNPSLSSLGSACAPTGPKVARFWPPAPISAPTCWKRRTTRQAPCRPTAYSPPKCSASRRPLPERSTPPQPQWRGGGFRHSMPAQLTSRAAPTAIITAWHCLMQYIRPMRKTLWCATTAAVCRQQ